MTSDDRPLPVFIHIHKNGGTSIRAWLQAHVPAERLLDTVIPRRWGEEVGVFGELEAFAARVGRRYGWTGTGLKHLNEGNQQGFELLTSDDLDQLAAANRYDEMLYTAVTAGAHAPVRT